MAIGGQETKDDLEEAPPLLLDEAARPRRVALFVEPSPFAYASVPTLLLCPFIFVIFFGAYMGFRASLMRILCLNDGFVLGKLKDYTFCFEGERLHFCVSSDVPYVLVCYAFGSRVRKRNWAFVTCEGQISYDV